MSEYPPDFDQATVELCRFVQPYTMTSKYALFALRQAVEHVVKHEIPGDIVECGVWKGGSMMAIAKTLLELGKTERRLHLFDTFDGMSEPTEVDRTHGGESAAEMMNAAAAERGTSRMWGVSPLEEVTEHMRLSGYPMERIAFVKGKVEETIPEFAPKQVALLRLDTDWFVSTYHELRYLYPRLSVGGILIIDDYGHWEGARRAVDQFISERGLRLLLNRVDNTVRMCVKVDQ
jgi:O-methyltransferase